MTAGADVIRRYKRDFHRDPEGLSLRVKTASGEAITLRPVQASAERVSERDVAVLTEWRNRNRRYFLTDFEATLEGTRRWLTSISGPDATRILFMIDRADGVTFGHVGLCNVRPAQRYAELDNVVRGGEGSPGAMTAAVTALANWARTTVGIEHLWVRVMADNPAVAFYESLGFRKVKDVPLEYVQEGARGSWQERAHATGSANRYLRYMEQAA